MKNTLLAAALSAATLTPVVAIAQQGNTSEFTQEEKDWIKLQYQFRDCVSINVGYGPDRNSILNDPAALQPIHEFCIDAIGVTNRQEFTDSYEVLEQRYPNKRQYLDMLTRLTEDPKYFNYTTPVMPK